MRTSGKVLKDFENLRKSLFDEEISHIAFMRDSKVEILYTQKYVDKLENQLQQKENIIREIREYIETHWACNEEQQVYLYELDDRKELLEILDKEVN